MNIEHIYVDTSAFYALMDRSDQYHPSAKSVWPSMLEDHIKLETSNYVVSETISLIQNRLGFEAAKVWYRDILEVLNVRWVDQPTHCQAYELWMSLGHRKHSLVDCISYLIMHQHHIEKAFCFKRGYYEQGFVVIAPMELSDKTN